MSSSNTPQPELPLFGPDRAQRVREMFARIVPRYDLINHLMTMRQDVRWRKLAAKEARPAGALVLDLATGTGDLAIELAHEGARRVVAVDYCEPMLLAARRKLQSLDADRSQLAAADVLALPFPDGSFDCVASGFLLRNVVDLEACLSEMRRVLRPGGRAVCLEITHPPAGLVSRAVDGYFKHIVPRLGAWVSGDRSAYRYLPASLELLPHAEGLAQLFRSAGFHNVRYRRLGLGAIAIHVAEVPSPKLSS